MITIVTCADASYKTEHNRLIQSLDHVGYTDRLVYDLGGLGEGIKVEWEPVLEKGHPHKFIQFLRVKYWVMLDALNRVKDKNTLLFFLDSDVVVLDRWDELDNDEWDFCIARTMNTGFLGFRPIDKVIEFETKMLKKIHTTQGVQVDQYEFAEEFSDLRPNIKSYVGKIVEHDGLRVAILNKNTYNSTNWVHEINPPPKILHYANNRKKDKWKLLKEKFDLGYITE